MRAIDAHSQVWADSASRTRTAAAVIVFAALVLAISFAGVPSAYAGQAATGDSLFYPCDSCHPVTGKPANLPNDFKKHSIKLVGHDKLGHGDEACLVCHDEPSKDPSRLRLADGSFTTMRGDVSAVCYRCHYQKYEDWKTGVHGKNLPKCTASGCHDPHTPAWIYAEPLLPFVGTGFEVRTVSERQPFKALAKPPVPPAVVTPWWLTLAAAIGGLWSIAVIAYLIVGRPRS